MLQSVSSEITRTRMALLAYVARYGVSDDAARRMVAARLWRAIPRGLNAAEAIAATDRALSLWASERVGFPISAAQLRLAVLVTGADATALLGDDVAGFVTTISPALLQATPTETLVDMPVQSFAKVSLAGLLAPAPVALNRAA